VSRKTVSGIVGLLVVVVGVLVGGLAHHDSSTPTASSAHAGASTWVSAADLPSQAREVLAEIDHGGPFEYPGKDGSVFGNYEGLLPREPSGYYHEYTVDTPGASTRGTRRIITGRDGELYYTDDHYNSFRRIRR
jgi:ribonuclease T1